MPGEDTYTRRKHVFLVRTSSLRQLLVFITRENTSLAPLAHIIIIINFFIQVFSECTEAVSISLIPLVTNFTEIHAFIIGFSFTVWTKMRPFLAH